MTEEHPMTIESKHDPQEKVRRQQASAISGGIFLIGLGVLIFTDWWWP